MAGAMQTLHFSLARLLKEILFSYVPAVYAIVLLFGIFPQVFGKGTDIETSLMSLLSFILLYLPAIWMGYKFTRDSAEFKGVDWLHDRNSSGKGRV
jgi:ABC-type nickel/cobalt efflux system permease component RcnA